jgi:hypothetical protein
MSSGPFGAGGKSRFLRICPEAHYGQRALTRISSSPRYNLHVLHTWMDDYENR